MKEKLKVDLKFFLFIFFGLLFPLTALTQDAVTSDSTFVAPQALDLNQIPDFGKKTRKLISDIQVIIDDNTDLSDIIPGVDDMLGVLAKKKAYLSDTLNVYQLDRLEREERELSLLSQRVTQWKERIQAVQTDISANDSIADRMIKVWQMTLDTMNLQDDHSLKKTDTLTVDDIKTEVVKFIQDLKVSEDSLEVFSSRVQGIQTQITITENQIGSISDLIASKRDVLVQKFWIPESPPIWEIRTDTTSFSAKNHIIDVLRSDWSIIEVFLKNHPGLPLNVIVILVLIFAIIIYLRFQTKSLYDDYREELSGARIVLENPLATTLMIGWFISLFVIVFPRELKDLITLLMLLPLIIILRKLEENWTWQKVVWFACAYLLALVIREIDYNFLSRRIFLLAIDFSLISIMIYLFKHEDLFEKINKYWYGTLPFFIRFLAIMSAIAILSNVFGSVQFAQLLTYVSLGIIIVIHVMKAAVLLTRNFVFLILLGPLMKYSNILKEDGKIVLHKMDQLFRLIGFIAFIGIILDLFGVKSEVIAFIINMIDYKFTVGEISFAFENILAFIITIQLSIWISAFIRYVLEKEVFPRTKMRQGIPNTIMLMIKFTFVLFGILFAFSAAGIQIDKLAIVMGALGVGIGFGLQNIINNFVSGIILALERPITIGDIIDIPGASGTVKDIGIRASTVRQWDGSDVIVPNGELISNKLTNWTFYDKLRRVKIDVRVPFDTSIEAVSKLLLDTTKQIPEVMTKPAAYLNFIGIGTSAMEITLYCWIKDSGSIFSLGTAIRKAVYKSLSDAGYDIPVPRQDLSIAPDKESKPKN